MCDANAVDSVRMASPFGTVVVVVVVEVVVVVVVAAAAVVTTRTARKLTRAINEREVLPAIAPPRSRETDDVGNRIPRPIRETVGPSSTEDEEVPPPRNALQLMRTKVSERQTGADRE